MNNSNMKRPLPPNMKWYGWLRITAIIGGIIAVANGIAAFSNCLYAENGSSLFSCVASGLLMLAYGATLIWLFGNMLYLTKTVYKVLRTIMILIIVFSSIGILMGISLLSVSYDDAIDLFARGLVGIIYAVLNLVYIRKRKHYFGYTQYIWYEADTKPQKVGLTDKLNNAMLGLNNVPLKEDNGRTVCGCIKSHTLHIDGHTSTGPFDVSKLSINWQKYLADGELYFYLKNIDGKIKRIITTKANWEEKLANLQKQATEQTIPEFDFDAYNFASDEERQAIKNAYATQMMDFVRTGVMKELEPALEMAKTAQLQNELITSKNQTAHKTESPSGIKSNKRTYIIIAAAIFAFIVTAVIAWNAGHNTADVVTPDGSKTVYITPTGEKYHRKNCKTIRSKKTAVGIDSAKKSGYTPCSRCHPGK